MQQRTFVINEAQRKLDALEVTSNKELLERAWEELSALCGAGVAHKNWTMSVPVDADRDSDIVFGEVLKRFAALEADNARLREALTETHVSLIGTRRGIEHQMRVVETALADADLSSLPTQQKPTEEGMEKERKIK